MKKWLLALFIVAAVATTGFVVVKATQYNTLENSLPGYFHGPGMMGGGYCYDEDDLSYEFLYSHLDSDQKTVIDQLYAEKLATYDFQSMTSSEQTDAINQIKAELVTYMEEHYFNQDYPTS